MRPSWGCSTVKATLPGRPGKASLRKCCFSSANPQCGDLSTRSRKRGRRDMKRVKRSNALISAFAFYLPHQLQRSLLLGLSCDMDSSCLVTETPKRPHDIMQRDWHKSKFPTCPMAGNFGACNLISSCLGFLIEKSGVLQGLSYRACKMMCHSSWHTVGAPGVFIRAYSCVRTRCAGKPSADFSKLTSANGHDCYHHFKDEEAEAETT